MADAAKTQDDDSSSSLLINNESQQQQGAVAAAIAADPLGKRGSSTTSSMSSSSKSPPPNNKKSVVVTINKEQVVKELGRKARSRFVEERSKRPEIKRLDAAPTTTTKTNETTTTTTTVETDAAGAVVAIPIITQKKRTTARRASSTGTSGGQARKRTRTTGGAAKNSKEDDNNVDYWLPDLSTLHDVVVDGEESSPASSSSKKKENKSRSNCVRLHGLPLGTTHAHIQQFFRGLEPERIVLLPSLNETIPTWDAAPVQSTTSTTTSKQQKRGTKQKQPQHPKFPRYPCHFRVLVKFQSAPTAALAVDRSGELLNIVTTTMNPKGEGRQQTMAVAIGVTSLPKAQASYLLRNMAMNAESSSSSSSSTSGPAIPLETTLSRMEKALGKDVICLLWMAAKHHLRLPGVDLSTMMAQANLPSSLFGKNLHRIKSQPTLLAKQRNELLALYNDDRLGFPAGDKQPLDPELFALDPILRLTYHAAKSVLQQVQRMDDRLLMLSRHQQLLSSSPFLPLQKATAENCSEQKNDDNASV